MKYEWRKQDKALYGAKKYPALITIPAQNYIMISGKGNPNDVDFSNRVGALYSLAYAVKSSYKAVSLQEEMVAELIDHIEVYHAEKQDGVTNQRVVIYYNCIGSFDVPDRRKIPEADIIMETRKGVALSYAPEQVAV